MPLVDVIMPALNNHEMTHTCLRSLHDRSEGFDYRVILIDNGSEPSQGTYHSNKLNTEPSRGPLLRPQDILIRNDSNLFVTRPWNQGLEQSSAPYVVILNNDLTFGPDFLKHLVYPLQEYPDRLYCSVPVVFGAENESFDVNLPYLPKVTQYGLIFCRFVGCSFALTRQCVNEVGKFDEQFVIYFQDNDYMVRMMERRMHPIGLALPAMVAHHSGRTHGEVPRDDFLAITEQDRQRYLWKHGKLS